MILFNKRLKKLLSNNNLLELTKHCIRFQEEVERTEENTEVWEGIEELWTFISELADAQCQPLPKYEF